MTPDAELLDPTRTVLLFFDMLNAFIKTDDSKAPAELRPVIANAVRLREGARANGVLVAYAMITHRADDATSATLITDTNNRLEVAPREPGPGIVGGTWRAQVIDEIAPEIPDYVIPKYRWSAFHQTYLDLALRVRGINTIIISGGSVDVGVAATAYAARDMDYNLVFARDACSANLEDNFEQFMNRVFPRMGRVRTTEQVLGMFTPERSPSLAPRQGVPAPAGSA